MAEKKTSSNASYINYSPAPQSSQTSSYSQYATWLSTPTQSTSSQPQSAGGYTSVGGGSYLVTPGGEIVGSAEPTIKSGGDQSGSVSWAPPQTGSVSWTPQTLPPVQQPSTVVNNDPLAGYVPYYQDGRVTGFMKENVFIPREAAMDDGLFKPGAVRKIGSSESQVSGGGVATVETYQTASGGVLTTIARDNQIQYSVLGDTPADYKATFGSTFTSMGGLGYTPEGKILQSGLFGEGNIVKPVEKISELEMYKAEYGNIWGSISYKAENWLGPKENQPYDVFAPQRMSVSGAGYGSTAPALKFYKPGSRELVQGPGFAAFQLTGFPAALSDIERAGISGKEAFKLFSIGEFKRGALKTGEAGLFLSGGILGSVSTLGRISKTYTEGIVIPAGLAARDSALTKEFMFVKDAGKASKAYAIREGEMFGAKYSARMELPSVKVGQKSVIENAKIIEMIEYPKDIYGRNFVTVRESRGAGTFEVMGQANKKVGSFSDISLSTPIADVSEALPAQFRSFTGRAGSTPVWEATMELKQTKGMVDAKGFMKTFDQPITNFEDVGGVVVSRGKRFKYATGPANVKTEPIFFDQKVPVSRREADLFGGIDVNLIDKKYLRVGQQKAAGVAYTDLDALGIPHTNKINLYTKNRAFKEGYGPFVGFHELGHAKDYQLAKNYLPTQKSSLFNKELSYEFNELRKYYYKPRKYTLKATSREIAADFYASYKSKQYGFKDANKNFITRDVDLSDRYPYLNEVLREYGLFKPNYVETTFETVKVQTGTKIVGASFKPEVFGVGIRETVKRGKGIRIKSGAGGMKPGSFDVSGDLQQLLNPAKPTNVKRYLRQRQPFKNEIPLPPVFKTESTFQTQEMLAPVTRDYIGPGAYAGLGTYERTSIESFGIGRRGMRQLQLSSPAVPPRVIPSLAPSFQERPMEIVSLRPSAALVSPISRTGARSITGFGMMNLQLTTPAQIQPEGEILKQPQPQKIIQPEITKQDLFEPQFTGYGGYPDLATPRPTPPFLIPPLGFPGVRFSEGKRRGQSKGRKYAYTPSLAALGFNLKSTAVPKDYSTGLVLRTIVTPKRRSRR